LKCKVTPALTTLIGDLKCDDLCNSKKRFEYDAPESQPTCSDPNAVPGEDDEYEFGCFCPQGFVVSGKKCKRPGNCGCTTPEGEYKLPNTVWRSADCKTIYTCKKGGAIQEEHNPCGANTTCENTDTGPQCKCKEGFYGNPEMPEGCEEGEKDNNGTKVCYKYILSDGTVDERCNCSLGFISNCNNCEDVDECKLGLHDCELPKEKCVNVHGGYSCECASGYKEVDSECADINECKNNPCGSHQACENTVGSYKCKCCAGYKRNSTNNACERDYDAIEEIPANAQCCAVCNIPEICTDVESDPQPVCYYFSTSVRKDFENGLVLFEHLCLLGIEYVDNNAHVGFRCQEIPFDTTTKTVTNTPAPTKTTEAQKTTTYPSMPKTCEDPKLPDSLPEPPMELRDGPVCGPSFYETPKTFPSYDDMLVEVCNMVGGPHNMPIAVVHAKPGACVETTTTTSTTTTTTTTTTSTTTTTTTPEQTTTKEIPQTTTKKPQPETTTTGPHHTTTPGGRPEPEFGPWSPFSSCQFESGVCGVGVQVRTRYVLPRQDGQTPREPTEAELRETRTCYKVCPNPGECPEETICDRVDPICGVIGTGNGETFESECIMNVRACKAKKQATKLHAGECDDNPGPQLCANGPVKSQVKYFLNSTLEECYGPETDIMVCDNMLCTGGSSTCCKAVEKSPIQVTITCYSHNPRAFTRSKSHVHYTATKCACQEREAEP
jgi:hypothetical protein